MCVFWFSLQLLFPIFLIPRRIQRDIVTNVKMSSCKVPLFLSDFNETWIFSTGIRKKSSNIKFNQNPSNESRVVPCGRTDGRTDMKLIVASRNSTNAPKTDKQEFAESVEPKRFLDCCFMLYWTKESQLQSCVMNYSKQETAKREVKPQREREKRWLERQSHESVASIRRWNAEGMADRTLRRWIEE